MLALDALILGFAPALLALRLAGLVVPLRWWLGRSTALWLGPVWLVILILGQMLAAYLWSRAGAPPAMIALGMGCGLLLIPIIGPACWVKGRPPWRLAETAAAPSTESLAPAILRTMATVLRQRLELIAGHLAHLDGDRDQINAAQRELEAAQAQLAAWGAAPGPREHTVLAPPRPADGGTTAPNPPGLGPVTRPFSILLVDEDRVGRTLMRMLLEREGHRVEETDDAKMGLEMALVEGPELVLIALRLDRHQGLALARCISAGKGPPVYLLRGPADQVTMRQVDRSGAQGVIEKPVTLTALRTLLTGLADHAPVSTGPVLDPTVLTEHLELLGPFRVVQIIDSFLATAPETLAVAAEALAARDAATLGRAAHKLASGALTVGATALADMAKHIDTSAKRGNADSVFTGAARLPTLYNAAAGALTDFRERHRPNDQG